MSTNQFSPQGVWFTWQNQQPPDQITASTLPQTDHHHHQPPLIPMLFERNRVDPFADMDLMFEKSLTPSDVGKLNRLVIPKQHAETHFPLASFSEEATVKGMSLTFEDELGRLWRFRYSYWNSSQSYVFTRGWSRFVKDKRLQAGDVVTFHRAGQCFYIGWKPRFFMPPPTQPAPHHTHPQLHDLHATGTGVGDNDHVQERQQNTQKRSVLRLFGVNMECHETDDDDAADQHHHHPF